MTGSRPAVQPSPTPLHSQTLVKTPWALHQILRSLCESVSAFHRRATKQSVSQSPALWRLDRRPAGRPTAGWQSQNATGAGECRDWNSLRTKPCLCDYCSPGSQWGRRGEKKSIPHDAFIVFQPNTHQAPQQPLPLYNGPPQITTVCQHFGGSCTKYVQHYMELFSITLSLSYAIKSFFCFFLKKQLYIFWLAASFSVKVTAGTAKDTNALKLNFNTWITEVQAYCDAMTQPSRH